MQWLDVNDTDEVYTGEDNNMEVDGFVFLLPSNDPIVTDEDADRLVEEINMSVTNKPQPPERIVVKLWDRSYNDTYVGSLTMYKDIALELNLRAESGGIIKHYVTPFEHSALISKVNEYTRIYELGLKRGRGEQV